MVHTLSVKVTSKSLPKDKRLVYFWDSYGVKRIGIYYRTRKFIELNTGHSFAPGEDIVCWEYKK